MTEKNIEKNVVLTTTDDKTIAPDLVNTIDKSIITVKSDEQAKEIIEAEAAAEKEAAAAAEEEAFQKLEAEKKRLLDIANDEASAEASEQASSTKRAQMAFDAAGKKRLLDEQTEQANKPGIENAKAAINEIKAKFVPPVTPPTEPQQPINTASQINADGTETPLETKTEKQPVTDGVDIFSIILIMISIAAIIGVIIRIVKPKIKTK